MNNAGMGEEGDGLSLSLSENHRAQGRKKQIVRCSMLILFLIWICKECTVMNGDRLSLFSKLWAFTEGQHSDTFHTLWRKAISLLTFCQQLLSSHHLKLLLKTSVLNHLLIEVRPMID